MSYRGYWTRIILNVLKDHQGTISIRDLADMTFIRCEDIISTLQHLNLIRCAPVDLFIPLAHRLPVSCTCTP